MNLATGVANRGRVTDKEMGRRLLLGLFFGFVVVLGLLFYADLSAVRHALGRFTWAYLPFILGLTAMNYLLRFVKWHYYLRLVGVRALSWRESLAIFLAGFSMTPTPAKAGEAAKAYWLKQMAGTPVARTLPVVMAERLSDGLAMLLLASAGILAYPAYRPLFAVVLGVLGAGILLVQARPLALRLLMLLERLPLVARFGHSLRAFYESSFRLLRLRPLLLAVGLGTISWAGEGVAFYLVLVGLGLSASPTLLFQAIFILAFSTIIGAVSTLPGGLGAAEVSLGAMLQLLVGLERGLAGTATLMIRLGTLWFGVLLGLLVLARYHRQLFGARGVRGGR